MMLNSEEICYNSLQLGDVGSEELVQPSYNLQAAQQHDFPFVRIHTFFEENNNQQPKLNASFRQHQNRNEIKAEPIKAELNDQNNGQITSNNSSISKITNTPEQNESNRKALPKTAPEKIKLLGCSKCFLLCTSGYKLKEHLASQNCNANSARSKILCPGCPNIFYSNLSLSAHLQYDHFLEADDITKYLSSNKLEQKSRIYLKNVECLRENQQKEPSTILNENNIDLNSNFCDTSFNLIDLINDDDNPVFLELQSSLPQPLVLPQQQQKISIKSVKTLCGEQSNFNDFITQENESMGNKILYNMDIDVQQQQSEYNDLNETNSNKKTGSSLPKIYIKNVDILKEPIYLPQASNNLQNESLHFNSSVETVLPSISINSTTNNTTSYPINYNHSNNFHSSTAYGNIDNYNTFVYGNNNEYQKKTRTKIYNKNTDMIKNTQISQTLESNSSKIKSNFLHLRTDLFNEDQVASNFVVTDASIPVLSNANGSHNYAFEDTSKQVSFANSIENEYIESFDPNENGIESNCEIENPNENVIIDSNSSSIQQYDLNTPQVMTPINIQPETNNIREDNEMLFVCAEEFINSNNLQLKETVETLNENVTEEQAKSFENLEQKSEKGRIYVSENLMENGSNFSNTNNVLSVVKKKSKGRPLGAKNSKRSGASDQNNDKKIPSFKCNFLNKCGFKFVQEMTLEYHRKCHSGDNVLECPECKSTDFSSWNNLHTHLWRYHEVDMELYSCNLCNFKTPILSRLLNTHSKIHSDERNYSCDECQKSFKNSKQLKNHRRIHRTLTTLKLHKCNECNAVFSTVRTKKEHICPKLDSESLHQLKCDICNKMCSSKNSFKLHRLTHETNIYKFQCELCDYKTNDHNSFRRHKGTHNIGNIYQCPYCDYKCIQTNMFKKHLSRKHPDLANNIIYKCQACSFSTINRTQYHVHLAKHGLTDNELLENDGLQNADKLSQNKIKVKSNLLLNDDNILNVN